MKQLSKEFITELVVLAKIDLPADNAEDFNPADVAGGNYDDAYYAGEEAGAVELARELLIQLGVDYD